MAATDQWTTVTCKVCGMVVVGKGNEIQVQVTHDRSCPGGEGRMIGNGDTEPDQRHALLRQAAGMILQAIGEDPERPGLADTPRRFADAWIEFCDYDPGRVDTTFPAEGQVDTEDGQMVVVAPIRVWTLCEHHLLPFWADLAIAYIARERLLGLSKFARIAQRHAHRLQVQERLVTGIGAEVRELVGEDVAVVAQGEHLCMTMRGIRSPARMISSALHGVFLTKPEARAEFMALAREAWRD